jgi:hypothetical protein
MIPPPPFITLATKTRQQNIWKFMRLNTPIYAGQSSVLFTLSEFLDASSFYLWEYRWTLSDKKGGSGTASFTHGDQVNWNHISTIPTPFVARAAKHRISRWATLTTELLTFIPASIPSRVTLPTPTELPSFVQYNHINMQSTDIAQQDATPMSNVGPYFGQGIAFSLQSCHRQCIAASRPSHHPMSLLTSCLHHTK